MPGFRTLACAAALAALLPSASPQAAEPRLVIEDNDYLGPVGSDMESALILLANPSVKVLGFTVVTGDAWRDEEAQALLRYLEIAGAGDKPVYPGAPFRPPQRDQVIEQQRRLKPVARAHLVQKGAIARLGPRGAHDEQDVVRLARERGAAFRAHLRRGGHWDRRRRRSGTAWPQLAELPERRHLQNAGAEQHCGNFTGKFPDQVEQPAAQPPDQALADPMRRTAGLLNPLRRLAFEYAGDVGKGDFPQQRRIPAVPDEYDPEPAFDQASAFGQDLQRFEDQPLDAAGPRVGFEIMKEILDIDPHRAVSAWCFRQIRSLIQE